MCCGSPSKLCSPPVPKNPFSGSRLWQPSQSSTVSVARGSSCAHSVVPGPHEKNSSNPFCWAVVRLLSRFRTGFGGSCTWSMKFAKSVISVAVIVPCFPTSPSNATMKLRKALNSSHGAFVLFASA